MTDRAIEHYDKHYDRGTGYRDSKVLSLAELARDRARRWLNRVSKDAHILDYGCADGYMLWVLHTLGYRNLVGMDVSEPMLRHARDRLMRTDVELRRVEPTSSAAFAGRFDLVLIHHVLEHIPRDDVIPALEHLRTLMKPGGLISVAVPNASSLLGIVTHAGDFTHRILYNEHSLRQVLELSGFEDSEVVLHPPKLHFSATRPVKMTARLLGYAQYRLNNALHRVIHTLGDQRPPSSCFERSIEILAYRPNGQDSLESP